MKPLRILLVDDEATIQEVMRTELSRLGHKVTACPNGQAAIKSLEKQTFDAAVLDLRMPGMSGMEVLEHLKAVAPDTEAVVMTGHASMDTAIEAIRLGAMDYITKPAKMIDIEAILLKVQCKLDLKNQNSALKVVPKRQKARRFWWATILIWPMFCNSYRPLLRPIRPF